MPPGMGPTKPAGFVLGWQVSVRPRVPCAHAITPVICWISGTAMRPHVASTLPASPVVAYSTR